MSTTMFGPALMVFSFCVMLAVPVAFDLIDCSCWSGPDVHEVALAFWTVLPPVAEFCEIEIDWCAFTFTLTGVPRFATVDPVTSVLWKTQAVFTPEPAV